MDGWGKIKAIAEYAGVSERTIEKWLKHGLKCTRMPSGLRLIKYEWVDDYLGQFADSIHRAEKIADEIFSSLKRA
jgi:excisionase family DNA binding protein